MITLTSIITINWAIYLTYVCAKHAISTLVPQTVSWDASIITINWATLVPQTVSWDASIITINWAIYLTYVCAKHAISTLVPQTVSWDGSQRTNGTINKAIFVSIFLRSITLAPKASVSLASSPAILISFAQCTGSFFAPFASTVGLINFIYTRKTFKFSI